MTQVQSLEIRGEGLTLKNVLDVSTRRAGRLALNKAAREGMIRSRQFLEQKLAKGETIYGVNTGFGAFSSVKISAPEITQLQKNLIRSHSCGVGDPFSDEEVRAILLLRANALARGHSGVRPEVVDKILEFLNADLLPLVPSQGSVGASGDLAPLSHVALALMGEGEIRLNGKVMPATEALRIKNVEPLTLEFKEGLSLINGCQVMTAVGLLAVERIRRLLMLCDLAGAMSLEALKGSRTAFDPLISATRPHPGESKTARNLLRFLGTESEISLSHVDCEKVQDAYSLRCMPAVHGAAKDAFVKTLETLETEANSSTDNPLVFAREGKILSCGNFHGEPVAFALDFLAVALSALASMSECRIEKMINPSMSGLPAFLAPHGGLNSGMMIVQVAAAALVSENKILAHPASVDSIPTSADKEDHVSMGTIAARKLLQVLRNAENVVAMEFLCATQALNILLPLRPAATVRRAFDLIREKVPFADVDRVFSNDIALIRETVMSEEFMNQMISLAGEFEW